MADTYDVHFQPVPSAETYGYKCFEFGFAAPLKVRGFQALVNRWVKTFMTPLGSDPLYRDLGTPFGNLVDANISDLSGEVRDIVNMAVQDANDQVKEQDLVGMFSDNERLLSAEVIEYVEGVAGFEVWVEIKNVAGDALQAPIATLTTG